MSAKRTHVVPGWPPLAGLPETAQATIDVKQLVQTFQSGIGTAESTARANAFSAIYNHYCRSIWDYIYYQVDGAEAEAKDIFSQVWLVALEELDQFEYRADSAAEDPLRSWLFCCAANRVKQFHREKRAKVSLDVVESFLWARLGGDDTTLFELFAPSVGNRANQLVYAITQQLSQEQKLILRLRYHGSMTFAEIGDYLGKSEGAVKVQHHRLLKKLRMRLDADPALGNLT
ncbi:MAG: sigma-70 family RNA polymerase sigma factor [Caldilineaceae bacterium]|nr:sigma-70 family RNA polymerase sigma factor [Caldilineaceae bacterium]